MGLPSGLRIQILVLIKCSTTTILATLLAAQFATADALLGGVESQATLFHRTKSVARCGWLPARQLADQPPAFAKVVVRSAPPVQSAETLCGELAAQDGATTVLKIKGEPDARQIPTQRLLSLVLVGACWPGAAK